MINHEPDIDETYLHAKDPSAVKYKLLRRKYRLKVFK